MFSESLFVAFRHVHCSSMGFLNKLIPVLIGSVDNYQDNTIFCKKTIEIGPKERLMSTIEEK